MYICVYIHSMYMEVAVSTVKTLFHFLSPGVQIFPWRDVSRSSCSHTSLLHQRESRSLPAQHLPLRRAVECTPWFFIVSDNLFVLPVTPHDDFTTIRGDLDTLLPHFWPLISCWCHCQVFGFICVCSLLILFMCVCVGGEGLAVETGNGLPECCDWTQLHDTDSYYVVWRQR